MKNQGSCPGKKPILSKKEKFALYLTPEKKAVLERLGWAPFRASSDLQLVPIRQLALFKEMQGVKSNKGLNEQDKLAKTTEIQAQLDDLDRLNNALSAMSSVSKAVQ